jgi:hypothetical protein
MVVLHGYEHFQSPNWILCFQLYLFFPLKSILFLDGLTKAALHEIIMVNDDKLGVPRDAKRPAGQRDAGPGG